MNYQELKNYSLLSALEDFLCDVEDHLDNGKDMQDILEMVESGDPTVIPWEPFEYYEPSSLANAIDTARNSYLRNHLHVLEMINGQEWVNNFKKEGE
jgi:hypothetical protein